MDKEIKIETETGIIQGLYRLKGQVGKGPSYIQVTFYGPPVLELAYPEQRSIG